ncbi:hypothetical protein GCM10027403_32940 [Arthrobacter tecti]
MSGFADYRPGQPGTRADLTLQPATQADLEPMLALQKLAGRPTSPQSLGAAIDDVGRLVVVAFAGDELAGWSKTHFYEERDGAAPPGQYLGGVEVAPAWRRRGVATALTDARLNWIAERAESAWYTVNVGNRASLELHRRWGFTEVARASSFHGVEFSGGVGLLLRADL